MRCEGTALRAARAALAADGDRTGADLRAALVAAADGWLVGLTGPEPDVALLAVGAYGRGDPALGSDLDLVLLHRGRRDVAALAERLWYPVWDSGVGLDHSLRTVPEALDVADRTLEVALGLLEARHVAGDPTLTVELRDRAHQRWRSAVRRRLPELAAAVAERAARAGEVAFLLEPDLKDGRGGLRDVQAMRAAAAAWVVDAPGPGVLAAYDVLLDVRGELHRRTRRPGDRLVMQEHGRIADALGYRDADELLTSVAAAGRAISFAGDQTWRRAARALRPPGRSRGRPAPRRPLAVGVVEQDGEVVLARDADPAHDPTLTLRVAAAAAEEGLPVAAHTVERLRGSAPLPEPWPAPALAALVALLGTGPAAVPVLEHLDQAGLVERLLPEWAAVRSRPQHNPVHRFTVDRHLMAAAAAAAALTRRVARPDLLLLAALLHDIGKGGPGDHTDAGVTVVRRIGPRLGLDAADTATLATLVRYHLLLPETATRRDLDDPATVRLVADAVSDRATLDLLHALAEADGRATGPAAWGAWKAGLVADLVRRTSALLTGAPPPAAAPVVLSDGQRALVDAGHAAVVVTRLPAPAAYDVTVAAPDRPGLLAQCAGVLALHRLDVRAATATSSGAAAVTVFTVTPRFGSEPPWDLVRDEVRRAVAGSLPLDERLAERERAYARAGTPMAPPEVIVDDDASAVATVVEVRTHDRAGLLYRLAHALAGCGLDVRSARVATLGAEVVDVFYVVGPDGGRVHDAALRDRVCAAVLRAAG